jgi:hypothetical protein
MRSVSVLTFVCGVVGITTVAPAQTPPIVADTASIYRPTISLAAPATEPLTLPPSVVPAALDNRVAALPRRPAYSPTSPNLSSNANLAPTNLPPVCDSSPCAGLVTFVGYDAFRGISDGSWENNGIHTGVNYGTRLGALSDLTGVGFQIGGSVGVFDWSGTDYRMFNQNKTETQGFFTYGFFRRPNESSKLNLAVVEDWMVVNNFGIYGQSIALSQWRVHAGYVLNGANEVGLWGTWRMLGDTHNIQGVGPTTWRPIDTLYAFWHHKWTRGGADTWISIGVPERDRLGGNGSLGDWLANAQASVPLNDRFGLYAQVMYLHPSARPGPAAATEDAWNFTIGVSFYPGRNARSNTVAGRCWLPALPVANNGLFLVDTNRTY